MQIQELLESNPDPELQALALSALRRGIEQIDQSSKDIYDRARQRSNMLYWLYNTLLKKTGQEFRYPNGEKYRYPFLKPKERGMPWSIQPPRTDTPVSKTVMQLINTSLRELGYRSQAHFVQTSSK
jgi:hypothetical protein